MTETAVPPFCEVHGCRGRWAADLPHTLCGKTSTTAASEPTWHGEIMRAGVDGLHRNDCWDSEDHQDCRDIVFAVLTGLADAGYRLVKP